MKKPIINSGVTKYGWVAFEDFNGKKESKALQTVEWPNGEGFDVDIDNKIKFELTWGEWEALKKSVRIMELTKADA